MRVLIRSLLVVALLATAVSVGLVWLWQHEVIELPAVAIRSMGRVAGVSVRGSSTVELPVSFHRQEHSLSCEIAALKMALGGVGVDVPEAELLASLPFDPTPRENGVWGDPQRGFVGDIDGKMFIDGYGVYWEPIAHLGLRWRRTEVIEQATPIEVAAHLSAGRPIVMWGYFGRGRPGSWQTSDGRVIQAVNGEHTRVITGFSGSVDAPTSFSLIDPITGSLSWSTTELMENWGRLGRAGVVVYPHPRWVRVAGTGRVWEISADGATRHWVPTWDSFVSRGGYKEAIVIIDESELLRYNRGSDVAG